MDSVTNIRKGLNISIQGSSAQTIEEALDVAFYAVKPDDYVGFTPRLLVGEGNTVAAGTPLLADKKDPRMQLCSPVAGTVEAVVRGEKRHIEAVTIRSAKPQPTPTQYPNLGNASREELTATLMACGLWPMLRQRPFGTIANPHKQPKALFISCFDTAPLAPDYDFILQNRQEDFLEGLHTLQRLTDAPLHLSFSPQQHIATLSYPDRCIKHTFCGPHPAGNVGTQIAHIDPINKGDIVWTVNPQDVCVLGNFMLTGALAPWKLVAFAGPSAAHPCYYRLTCGASIESIVARQCPDPGNLRFVSGNVLSGTRIQSNGFLSAADSLISVLPEGNDYEFMGWLRPGLHKFSATRTFLSGFRSKESTNTTSHLHFDTNLHGGVRPMVFGELWERLMPFDIYPMPLLKAATVGDIDLMEQLGILELEPEDIALCEFADTSKTELQVLLRQSLELIRASQS